MKPLIKSGSLYEKKLKELRDKKICGFCHFNKDLVIKNYKYWKWVYSEFPYWKYNTIVICKKHKMKFSELSSAEMLELKKIFSETEKIFLRAGITKPDQGWGMDILWRQRVNKSGYETRSPYIFICVQIKKDYLQIY